MCWLVLALRLGDRNHCTTPGFVETERDGKAVRAWQDGAAQVGERLGLHSGMGFWGERGDGS